jgi:hypothetical protein
MAADFTSDDVNALRDTLASLNQTMVNLGNSPRGNRAAPTSRQTRADKEQLQQVEKGTGALKKMGASVVKVAKQAEGLEKEIGSLNRGLSDLKKLFAIGTAVGVLTNSLSKAIDSYREMASVGQTFGGSMLKMQIAAAEARLPLEEFTAMVKKSSTVIAATGIQAFSSLNRSLRDNLTQFGMLNMTTSDLTDYLQGYMETQQSWGLLAQMDTQRTATSMKNLAIETTKVSILTGKSRETINKVTMAALQDDSLRSKMYMMQSGASQQLVDSLGKATAYLAGMPGEAGDTLSRMLAQTVGRGSAMLSDDMKGFVNAGMFGVTDLVDNLKRKIESGTVTDKDMDTFRQNFVRMGKQNMSSLKYMADFGNDPDARKAVSMITSMANLDGKKIKEIEQQATVTKFMMNLQNAIKNVTGFLREKFYKSLEFISIKIDEFSKSPGFKTLMANFENLGLRFEKWLKTTLTEENMTKWGGYVTSFIDTAVKAGSVMAGLVAQIAPVIGAVIDGLSKVNDSIGPVGLALGGLATYIAAKFAIGKVSSLMNERFSFDGGSLSAYRHNSGALKVWVMNGGPGVGSGGRGGSRAGSGRPTTKPQTRMGRIGSAIGNSRIGSAVKRGAGKIPINMGVRGLAGGLGGAALGLGLSAMNSGGPFKGSGALNLLGGAATGAMTGAMFGPIGAALGGVVGGAISAVSHWDELSGDISSAFTTVTSAAGSLWESSVAGLSKSRDWIVETASTGITAVKTMITDIFGRIGSWFGEMFNWVADLFTGNPLLATLLSATPIGAAVVAATKVSSFSTSKPIGSVASVDSDALQMQITTLRQQQDAVQKENADLKNKIAKLMEIMQESVDVQRAGLGGLIGETKKGNRDIGSIARGTI